jgi:hypothetical protein
MMRPIRWLGGSLAAAVLLAACSDTSEMTGPAPGDDARLISPMQTPVDVHAVFSGPPNREPNQISLNDPSLFVQILDVEQYIPRPASPSDVRIGDDWETGTPAENFEIFDINNDGNRDIQLRFDLQQLIDDGHIGPETTEITVWGRDPTTTDLFYGEAEVEIIEPEIVGCFWDNGPMITHPEGGTGPIAGAHVSMSSPAPHNTAGSNVLLSGAGPHFRVADDFVVDASCILTEIVTHGYRTGGPPNWTSANLNLRSGSVTGPIVATVTTTNWEFTGVYRTFNTVLNNADRPIHRIRFSFDNLELDPGTYWIDWQAVGGTSAWANYVMGPPNPPGAFNPPTIFENGQQMTVGGVWQPMLDPPGAEIPFLVRGPDAPPLAAQRTPVAGSGDPLPPRYNQQEADTF